MNIAAIILNYFGHADTVTCIESLAGQGLSKILVLDNSNDTVEECLLRTSLQSRINVEIVPCGRNLGFAAGVNHGLKLLGVSQFDAFLLLNNDTLATPGMVQRLTDGVERLDLGLASPVIRCYPETHRIWSQGNYYNPLTGMTGSVRCHTLRGDFHYLTGCCLLVRREVFEAVGLMDEAFFMYGEDVEFNFRAKKRGFRIGLVQEAVIYHKVSASARPNSYFYEYAMNLGHMLLTAKLAKSASQKVVHHAVKTLSLSARAVVRTLRHGNSIAIQGYAQALRRFMFDRKHQP